MDTQPGRSSQQPLNLIERPVGMAGLRENLGAGLRRHGPEVGIFAVDLRLLQPIGLAHSLVQASETGQSETAGSMDTPVASESLHSGVQIYAGRVKRDARSSVFAAELVRPPGVKRARQVADLPLENGRADDLRHPQEAGGIPIEQQEPRTLGGDRSRRSQIDAGRDAVEYLPQRVEPPLPEHVRQPAADRCDVEIGRQAQGSTVRLHALRIPMQQGQGLATQIPEMVRVAWVEQRDLRIRLEDFVPAAEPTLEVAHVGEHSGVARAASERDRNLLEGRA